MEQKDIVIPQDKSRLLFNARQRVNSLFQVEVGGFNNKTNRDSGSQWINLKGSSENIEKAQKYINSLCSPQTETSVEFPSELLESLQTKCRELEKSNFVYISFPSNCKALIQGCDQDQLDIAITQSELEEFVKKNSPRSVCREPKPDTSRDTRQSSFESTSNVSQVSEPLNLDYLKDFASKLGYTEDDLQSVISKLGRNVSTNQLLNELIKVKKSSKFLKDERPRMHPQVYTQPQLSPVGSTGLPPLRTDIVARGAPSSVPDRGAVISRGASSAVRLDSDYYTPRSLVGSDDRQITTPAAGLRPIVIDGSNVAMSHGNQKVFSCLGIQICVDWFLERGHKEIYVFVPSWRKEGPNSENPISNQEILYSLEQKGYMTYTPSRRVNGRRVICYDDRYIIKLAAELDGIVVSNDTFRDLENESPKFKDVIEKRLLMYSFVNDYFLPPDDPLGRFGPSLEEFLMKGTESSPRICPFLQKRKCTYGARCRFYHPERDGGSVKKQTDLTSKTISEISSRDLGTPVARGTVLNNSSDTYSSAGVVSRDLGSAISRGTVLNNPTDSYSELHPGISQNLYSQQSIPRMNNVHGISGHGELREQYREGYSRPAPHHYPHFEYGQVYQQPQYVMPHGQWVDNSYVVPRGHPPMGYPTPYQTYSPQGVPQVDFIPPMQAYPPAQRVQPDQRVSLDMDKSRIIGQRQQQYRSLLEAFPHQEERVLTVMKNHPNELDVNNLAMLVSAFS